MSYAKQLASIEASLQPGEKIIGDTKGTLKSLTGPIVATNQRIVFHGSNGLKKEQTTYPLNQVVAIEYEQNRMSVNYVTVRVAGDEMKFLVQRGNNVEQFVTDAREALAAAHTAGAGSSGTPDVVDQIAKLASLRDQGVLTDDEFASKKAQLLERL